VARNIRDLIHNTQTEQRQLQIFQILPERRAFGVLIDDRLYLATLVDLPTILEA
jgi:TATA-binding protein-associated factor Taf7